MLSAILLDAVKEIIVVGADWRFRALVRAELRECGYAALGWKTLEEAQAAFAGCSQFPAALVFDATGHEPAAVQGQLTALATRLPVILVLGAAEPAFTLPAGIRLLRRPVRIDQIVQAVASTVGPAA